jgi:FkbM family methyltransferase
MNWSDKVDWVVIINDKDHLRYGVSVRHIISGNDGDVCIAFITEILLKDKVNPFCIDIGVDQGWWSFFVVDKNSTAKVLSFEPNPLSYKNLLPYLTNEPRIELHNLAISNTKGTLPFTLEEGQSHSRDATAPLTVPCTLINSFIEGKSIDLIKIDTEGHELHILPTLYPYLSQIESLIIEISAKWYNDDDACLDMLNHLLSVYPAMYFMSRSDQPSLFRITKETVGDFRNHKDFQWDAFVTRNRLFC